MKKDELNNLNINNKDGHFEVEENSLKNIKEIDSVPEREKEEKEVFESSEDNKVKEEFEKQSIDQSSSSSGSNASASSSAASTVASVGGIAAIVAVSAVFVLGVVTLPSIPAVDVHLINATATSLSFSLNTNIENHEELTITLKGVGYEVTTPFQEYVKFIDLKANESYSLSVLQNETTSRYSSNFFTNDKEDINSITITVTSYIDDKLYFYFEDSLPGEKMYTVSIKDKGGKTIFIEDTTTPKEYEIDNFVEDVAIFVAVNGTISAGVQVFKPLYDYEHIEWIWGEYGETVTAIIPSTNQTEDYYVRDIRNFEIERKDPTCTEDGYVIRQAAFIGPDKNRYESEKNFILPALGHDFTDVTYTWSNQYQTCHAEAICPHCEVKIEETVEVDISHVDSNKGISYDLYTASFTNENFSTRKHYENLTYGNYPQTKVDDTDIISALNDEYGTPITQEDKWEAYSYYENSEPSSYMYYIDIDNDEDGNYDYRGIYLNSYRPINTTDPLGNSSYQYDNNYELNTAYWFRYEPISWTVLNNNENTLFITSDIILDSQSMYHTYDEHMTNHNGGLGYINNYELSDIRIWLNDNFYNEAFINKEAILTTEIDNSLDSTLDSANPYICANTDEKVFLLSRYDAHEYLNSNDLSISGSDYAKSQGLYVANNNNKAFWALRSPYPNASYQIRYITNNGTVSYDSVNKTSLGIRPACYINIE